jgi:hypothetical protein
LRYACFCFYREDQGRAGTSDLMAKTASIMNFTFVIVCSFRTKSMQLSY